MGFLLDIFLLVPRGNKEKSEAYTKSVPDEHSVYSSGQHTYGIKNLTAQKGDNAQLLKNSTWLLHIIGDEAATAAHDSSEVARTLNGRCYPHTGNGEHSWCLSSSLPLSVGFSIQVEALDVARSGPKGAHCHADVIYLGIKKGA